MNGCVTFGMSFNLPESHFPHCETGWIRTLKILQLWKPVSSAVDGMVSPFTLGTGVRAWSQIVMGSQPLSEEIGVILSFKPDSPTESTLYPLLGPLALGENPLPAVTVQPRPAVWLDLSH